MNKILTLFPVVALESIIDNHEYLNQKLMLEIHKVFDNLDKKRVLSHKWNSNVITDQKDQLGYTSFMGGSLTENANFNFFPIVLRNTVAWIRIRIQIFGRIRIQWIRNIGQKRL